MPDICLSCGVEAVIEVEVDGEGSQRICIECASVASGPRSEEISTPDDNETSPNKSDELVCESCGETLSTSLVLEGLQTCPECQALEDNDPNQEKKLPLCCNAETDRDLNIEISHGTDVCISCGCKDLIRDCIGMDERKVCRGCGSILAESDLVGEEFFGVSRSYMNTLPTYANKAQKLKGLLAGHNKISILHDKLCFSEVIKAEALEMFEKVFYKKEVFYAQIVTKENIAAACLFIVCRLHDIPICLTHFKPHLDKFSAFTKANKKVLKYLDITLPHMNTSSQVSHYLEGHGFDSKMVDKVKDILFLCRQAWLTQGRAREGLIVIALYYAYLSVGQGKGKVTLNKFREMYKFPAVSSNLHKECNNLFLKLARTLPWVSGSIITMKTLYRYIDDILKYQNSLFHLAFKRDYMSSSSDNAENSCTESSVGASSSLMTS
ncbi:unnamed protein product, partial [Lymnaea stagnalis]